MDDSSFFMQWAMDTLHQLPSDSTAAAAAAYATDVAGDAFPSLQALRNASAAGGGGGGFRDLTVQVDQVHRANSWSSSDSPGGGAATAAAGWSPHVTGGGGRGHRPMSWNFSAASAQPTTEDSGGGGGGGVVPAPPQAMETTATARAAVKKGGGGSSSSAAAPGYVQDHIIAERRRREKINQRFIELSTVIPGLKKMDKATILGDAVKYVKELQEKVKTLEEEADGGRAAMVVRKSSCSGRQSAGGDGDGGTTTARMPEMEVRVWERSVLVRVQCGNARGLLVRLLSEVEELRLAITHTSVMPFPASTVIITITAKAS
uniref:BHLH domain-containing protein n=1 Tax=Oryza meridionalis TaxID=40149 RepID=A0A0E0FET4_9ORYZ